MQVNTHTSSTPGVYWQWRGHSIYYVKAGYPSSKPPLLLVHGFGASTDHWRKNIAQLQENFEVWAIDLLGFGRSAKPKTEYSGGLWRDQLYDFICEVVGQPSILAGNSLGGYACLSVAAQRSDAATGLVLLNSAGPFTDAQVPDSNPLRETVSKTVRLLLQQSWASYLLFQYVRQPWMIEKTLKQVYLDHSAVTPQLVEDIYRPSCDRGALDVFRSVFSSPRGENVDVLLSQLQLPLLLLWGEADPWMNARDRGSQFRQYYPSLTEYYLKAGHCPHDEVPEQVNRLLTHWIHHLSASTES